jgi:hypothetical protein
MKVRASNHNVENTPPKGDPEKSRGELTEGRPHPQQGGRGLRGKDDKHGRLLDTGGGTYDPPEIPDPKEFGEPAEDLGLPEGLRRKRMGPYDRDVGRAETAKKK